MDASDIQFSELMKKIKSKNEEDKRYAARIIGERREKRGIKPLIMLLYDKSDAVKETAAEALARIDGREVVREILPLLRSEKVDLRNIVIEILEEIGEPAIKPLSLLLKDKDNDIRKFACDIMGNIGSPEAVSYLILALDDPHINVACSACEALGNIKDKKAMEALLKVLKVRKNLKNRKWLVYNAVEALGKIKEPCVIEELMKLSSSKDPLIIFTLVKSLGEIGDVKAIDYLLSCLDSSLLNKVAIEAIAKIARKNKREVCSKLKSYPEKLSILRKLLNDPSARTRKNVAFILGVAKDKEATAFLIPLLSDEEEVREEVMRALLTIEPEFTSLSLNEEYIEAAREILEVFLYDNDKELRELANKALRKLSSVVE